MRNEIADAGYAIVPAVLDAARTTELRHALARIFAQPSPYAGDIYRHASLGSIFLDVFNRYPELAWVPFHPPIVAALKRVLGDDYVLLPEHAAHDSGYGDWHKDTTSQERAGHRFHWDADFLMVQVGLYLQDNTPELGGGLDVVPGSHKTPDRYVATSQSLADRIRAKARRLGLLPGPQPVPSRAGDLVIFDFRIDHKASWPREKPVPESARKLALFFSASRNNAHVQRYLAFLRGRSDYAYLNEFRYAPAVVEAARSAGVSLAVPS